MPIAPVDSNRTDAYVCVVCKARWTYAEIRNIARCSSCDGGLVRINASPADPEPA